MLRNTGILSDEKKRFEMIDKAEEYINKDSTWGNKNIEFYDKIVAYRTDLKKLNDTFQKQVTKSLTLPLLDELCKKDKNFCNLKKDNDWKSVSYIKSPYEDFIEHMNEMLIDNLDVIVDESEAQRFFERHHPLPH